MEEEGDTQDTDDTSYPLLDFFERKDGDWLIKDYVPKCEFCGLTDCERMEDKEDLDDTMKDYHERTDLTNASKRYKIYRMWVNYKYGAMGPSIRVEINDCVRCLITTNFPPPPGMSLTRFQETV